MVFCASLLAATLAWGVYMPQSEADKLSELYSQIKYDNSRQRANAQLNSVFDQAWNLHMMGLQQRALILERKAMENPSFEADMAALEASCPPSIVPTVYEKKKREICAKWNVPYKKGIKTASTPGPRREQVAPRKPKLPPPTVEQVVQSAERGRALADKLTGGGAQDDKPQERDLPSATLPDPAKAETATPVANWKTVKRPGQKHPFLDHVVRSTNLKWRPEPGYSWVAPVEHRTPDGQWMRQGVQWTPGKMHDEHPHVVAGEKEGTWKPEKGWRWASHKSEDWGVCKP